MSTDYSEAICFNCGTSVTGAFCTGCGTARPLGQSGQSTPLEMYYCPGCGQTIAADSAFCEHCGVQLAPPEPLVAQSSVARSETYGAGALALLTRSPAAASLQRELTTGWDSQLVVQALWRTAAAWGGVLILMALAVGSVNSLLGEGDTAPNLPVLRVASLLLLSGLGATLTAAPAVGEYLVLGGDGISGSAGIRFALLIVPLLLLVAFRVAQIRRPAVSSKIRYAALSLGMSLLIVLVLTMLAGGRVSVASLVGPEEFESTEVNGYVALSINPFFPLILAAAVTLLALVGLPRKADRPEVAETSRLLARVALNVAGISLAVAAILAIYLGLASGTGAVGQNLGVEVGIGQVAAAVLGVLLLLPNLAVALFAAILQMRPTIASNLYGTDLSTGDLESWNDATTFAGWPPWVTLVSLALLVVVIALVAMHYGRTLVAGMRFLWAYAAVAFAVSGALLGWISNAVLRVDVQYGSYYGTGSFNALISGPYEVLNLGLRAGLLGALLGLLAHPAVLPHVRKFVPQGRLWPFGVPKWAKMRPEWTEAITRQDDEWPRPRIISPGGLRLALAAATTLVAALVAIPIGGLISSLYTSFNGGPAEAALSLQVALQKGDGEELARLTGAKTVPVGGSGAATAQVEVVEDSEEGARLEVSWAGSPRDTVYLSKEYSEAVGLLPVWQVGSMSLPSATLESFLEPSAVKINGIAFSPRQSLVVMPGQHALEVAAGNAMWQPSPSSGSIELNESTTIDIEPELTEAGRSAAIDAANAAVASCQRDSDESYCPPRFGGWPTDAAGNTVIPALTPESATIELVYGSDGVRVEVSGGRVEYERLFPGRDETVSSDWLFDVELRLDGETWQPVS